jgi:hypothetical protein
MAEDAAAEQGKFLHICDDPTRAGRVDGSIPLFEEFDYSDVHPLHKPMAPAKDGTRCRDTIDTQWFLLLRMPDVDERARIGRSSTTSSQVYQPNCSGRFVPPIRTGCVFPVEGGA